MKQGWEIKKLGEIATIVSGSTPKTNDSANWNGYNYWVTPAELNGDKWISSTERTITDLGVKNAHLQLLPAGTVLLSSRAPIGKVAITTVEMYCNQGFKNIVCSEQIINEFVYWFLFNNTVYLNSLGTGATFKEISKRVVEQIPIPVPPREEQERIVGELDCLSEIIENKRAQLRELDALAQSIFYTMFGDPIANDKGWETKKLPDICSIISTGITYKPENVADEGTIVLRSGNIQNSRFVLDDIVRINMPLKESQYVQQNDILMCSRNGSARLVGKVALIPNTTERMSWGAFMTIIRTEFYYFLYQYFQLPAFRQQLIKTKTSTVNQITIGMLKDISVPFPPILLQQQFAEKIENIERQKELIKQSIKETEDLFNSRMDYYFN